MAKRHHESMKDRMHERRGEERMMKHRSERKEYRGSYEGMDERRRQETEDEGMIREDRNACANLPQNVMYHEWPTNTSRPRYELDDTGRGIDKQEREDEAMMNKHIQPGKY